MMKQMTIKKKVTLWYTGIIALILGMVLVFMFYFVDKVGISATEEEVSAAVTGLNPLLKPSVCLSISGWNLLFIRRYSVLSGWSHVLCL